MHLNELPYTVMRKGSTTSGIETSDANNTCIIRVSNESIPELLIVPPLTVGQMNFMRPEITVEANHYNAGICPSDDAPSIEMEIRQMLEQTRESDEKRNEETERIYGIMSADDILKMKVSTLASPVTSPNLVIKSVRSIPVQKTTMTTGSMQSKVITLISPSSSTPNQMQTKLIALHPPSPLSAPSTSKGLIVTQSPVTKVGESSLTISHVACGVEFKDNFKPTVQSEIDLAARSLVKGSGFDGTDLYRCGLSSCSLSFGDEQQFLQHLILHLNARGFACVHCGLRYEKAISLKNHIKSHGTHRYFCFCCNHTEPVLPTMIEHFKETHSDNASRNAGTLVNETITLPLNEQHVDNDRDMFVVCPRGTLSINAFGLNLVQQNKTRILETKKFYLPEEKEMLPRKAIFPESVACQLCGYSSKIRSNILRHLIKGDCAVSTNVPGTDPVNPVPCLDTGERHFDKMRNLAASSNTSDAVTIKAIEQRFQHVPEDRRFVCGARTCHYQTQTEDMLRSHIVTLHTADEYFFCPHCNRDLAKTKVIKADDVLNHLRIHGPKLFKCPMCPYCHYTKQTVDKHMSDAHPRCKEVVIQLRPKQTDTSKTNKQAIWKWKCNVCVKAVFDTRQLVRIHLAQAHRLNYQYQCISANCSYQSDTKNQVKDHILTAHGSTDVNRVKTVYERVEGEIDVTPIWRRDDPNRVCFFYQLNIFNIA